MRRDFAADTVVYDYDSINIPRNELRCSGLLIIPEEKRLINRLNVEKRSQADKESGLIRIWQGPFYDRIALL